MNIPFRQTAKTDAAKTLTPVKILLGLELLCLLIGLCQYLRPLRQYDYRSDDLVSNLPQYMVYEETDCYPDGIRMKEDAGDLDPLYITTPYLRLPGGSYEVSILYRTDTEGQEYTATSKYRTYPVHTAHEHIELPPEKEVLTFSFYSPLKVENYQIHINYNGSGRLLVQGIQIHETNAWKNVFLFYVLLFSAVIDLLVLVYRRASSAAAKRELRLVWAVLAFLVFFSSLPIFDFFLRQSDDLLFHLNRIEAIKASLLNGQFPNRVSAWWNLGYGYAVGILYGELFLYLPALLRILGFSVQGAYKLYLLFINLGTAAAAYCCFKKCFKQTSAALIGCGAYMLMPYRLVCLFLRASVGEYTAMLFFPLIFYGLYRLCFGHTESEDYKKSGLLLLIGYTGVIQSHVISCVIIAIFSGLFLLAFLKRILQPRRLWQLVKIMTGVVLLNLWFLVPFADYFLTENVRKNNYPSGAFSSSGVLLGQMFSFFQRAHGASHTITETLTSTLSERNYALGAGTLVIALYLCLRLYQGKSRSRIMRIGDFSMGLAAVALFMSTIWFPWDWIHQMNGLFQMITNNLQYPWRFLGIAGFFTAVTAVCLVRLTGSVSHPALHYSVTVALCALYLLSAGYFLDDYTETAGSVRYIDECDLDNRMIGNGEFLPENVSGDFSAQEDAVADDHSQITSQARSKGAYIVSCVNDSSADGYVDVPILPCRGYRCTDSATGENLAVQLDVPGCIRVIVPSGYNGTFRVAYREPLYWRAAELISLLTLLVIAGGFLSARRAKRPAVTTACKS